MATSWGAPCDKKTKTAALTKCVESQNCWLMHACWPQKPVSSGSNSKTGEGHISKDHRRQPAQWLQAAGLSGLEHSSQHLCPPHPSDCLCGCDHVGPLEPWRSARGGPHDLQQRCARTHNKC